MIVIQIRFMLLIGGLAAALGIPERAAAELLVGVARVDITPDYPVRLNGFGFRRDESAGVRQPIWAKALAISADGPASEPLVLITVDTLGIPDSLTRRLAQDLAAEGVRPERLAVMATHTHTAPMVNHVSPTIFSTPIPPDHQARIDRYSSELAAKLLEVARAALSGRQPSEIRWGIGRVGFAANRRTAGGPVDHDLPMLAVFDPAGNLRAVWVNYACHCVTLSDNLISGDWAGYAQSEIERLHASCTALVSIGCGADANPDSGVTGDRVDIAQSQGVQIATEVTRLLATELVPLTLPVEAQLDRIRLPLATLPTQAEWEQLAARDDAVGFHAKAQLARLASDTPILTEIDYPIQTWRFGDRLALVFLPGEVVVDYALRLKRELDGRRVWINAYANHCPGYVPSERILREGGYEGGGAMVYYDIPGPYAPGLEQKIVDTVRRQVGAVFEAAPAAPPGRGTQGSLPRSPSDTLASFEIDDSLQVELAAAEPLIASPVAIAFGLHGELWVAEMFDYPTGIDGRYAPGGRIKRLTDHDLDGRFDEATVFLEDIPFPTGVTVWRDGLLVCSAPDILFARDVDGDGRADQVERLFQGFGTSNYQGRVNSLEYGLDGWVYGSCGLFGGTIINSRGDAYPLGDRDFRIRPDEQAIEAATGRTQQGRVRDDAGNWFGCDNSTLVYHYPLADHDLRRNPRFAAARAALAIVSDSDPGRLFPRSSPVLFQLSGPPGRPTAACGLGICRDDYLGDDFYQNAFVCEPVNNLVTRRRLSPEGSSFRAERVATEADSEFLASTDPWFRPVQARTGPDGALWIVDMYRYVIEHPIWIPPDMLAQLDVRAGASRGRIYRVVRRDRPARRPAGTLDSAAACVESLNSPNGTWRDLAAQQLLWNRDNWRREAVDRLMSLCRKTTRPLARMQAIALLDQLDGLESELLIKALSDDDARVRRIAAQIARSYADDPDVAEALLARQDDSDPHVRLQAACSLGHVTGKRAAAALARILHSAPDTTGAEAVACSLTEDNLAGIVCAAFSGSRSADDARKDSSHIATDDFASHRTLLARQAGAFAEQQAVRCVIEWLERTLTSSDPLPGVAALEQLLDGLASRPGEQVTASWPVAERLEALLADCRSWAVNDRADVNLRVAAVGALAAAAIPSAENVSALVSLLDAPDATLAGTALAAIQRHGADDVPAELLRRHAQLAPAVRARAIGALLSRADWTGQLLDAIRTGTVSANDLSLAQQQQLLRHQDERLRRQAEELLPRRAAQDRPQVVARYAQPPWPTGDAERGRQVFTTKCAVCHQADGTDRTVGPDIASYGRKPYEALLVAVFDPNQAVDPRYVQHSVITTDGRTLAGVIHDETATGFVVTDAQGRATTLLRSDVELVANLGVSLMPEGLESELPPASMADLFAFLATQGLGPGGRTAEGAESAE